MKNLTALQKGLLAWSVLFLIAAEALKYAQLSGRTVKLVGVLELGLGIVTGIAVGFAASVKKELSAGRLE